MAVSYPGKFRALAIQSASYATCSGALCTVPGDLPPTLFLHGERDDIVPIGTAEDYRSRLQALGVETMMLRDPQAGHEWLPQAPSAIAAWFAAH
jgi:dipeptidyl aminopeptidase/acylaminoacyl peptidase